MMEKTFELILLTATDYNLTPSNMKTDYLEEIVDMIESFNRLYYPNGDGLTYIVGECTKRILRFRIDYRNYDWETLMGVFV